MLDAQAGQLGQAQAGLDCKQKECVTRFVLRACQLREGRSAALRSLLRYLHLEGKTPDLVAAVPAVAGWRGGQLPRGLEPQQVARMLAACDRGTVAGRRDYAMLMLLARLGLRGVRGGRARTRRPRLATRELITSRLAPEWRERRQQSSR